MLIATPHQTRLSEMTDEEVFRRYQEGETEAFRVIVDRYAPRLRKRLTIRMRDEDAAEDVLQLAFADAHHWAHTYDPSRRFSAWIYTIANNRMGKEFLSRANRSDVLFSEIAAGEAESERDERPVQFASGGQDPEHQVYRQELRLAIMDTISQIAEEGRQAFVMYYLEGLSQGEVAQELGLPLTTVHSRVERAREAFRALFPRAVFN